MLLNTTATATRRPKMDSFRILRSLRLSSLLLLSSILFLLLLLHFIRVPIPFSCSPSVAGADSPPPSATHLRHLLFGIASSSRSWTRRKPYLRLWWRPGLMRGAVFIDSRVSQAAEATDERDLPTVLVSADTSRLPYAYKGGLRAAVRVARIVKELVDYAAASGDDGDVRWVVLGDDDTVFFPDNLVATLAKYDWKQWYYVGGRSESAEQNLKNSFGMAFGGGGVAISYPLAVVLARNLDSCLLRYADLYGSDARVFSCLMELGVALTHEPGFHQVDLRGNIFGLLAAHPLTPLVSLHHLEHVEPLFPGMDRMEALRKLFKAIDVDPGRVLHQTVCYDSFKSHTISVSWGYVIQVFEGNQRLPDLLSSPQTFTPWTRGRNVYALYMFDTKEHAKDPCRRPAIFFLDSVIMHNSRIDSNYTRDAFGSCAISSTKDLNMIRVSSHQFHHHPRQVIRRECCDVLNSSSEAVLDVNIRKCKEEELIMPHM